jgi:hypothetical protein
MYMMLTTAELTVLQNILYEGTEEAYQVTGLGQHDPHWFDTYRPVHAEVGRLFLAVGQELLTRLDREHRTVAA